MVESRFPPSLWDSRRGQRGQRTDNATIKKPTPLAYRCGHACAGVEETGIRSLKQGGALRGTISERRSAARESEACERRGKGRRSAVRRRAAFGHLHEDRRP